jgi:hypothetical protein
MAEKIKIGEVRPPQGNFDIYEDVDRQTFFVDGVAATNVGSAVTKLDLFESGFSPLPPGQGMMTLLGGPEAPPEQRTVIVRIAIPTRVLLEFCVNTLKGLHSIDFAKIFDTDTAQSKQLIDSIKATK